MQLRSKLVAAGAATTIGLASFVGVASAQTESTSLVDKLSQRFNIDKSEVQKVFDENKTQHQAERQQRSEAHLSQAVKDGKLTEEQKSKILAKQKELMSAMDSKRESMKSQRVAMANKTEAERQQLMEQHRTEMDKQRSEIENWEKQNNIPSGYLGLGGPGGGHGHGRGVF